MKDSGRAAGTALHCRFADSAMAANESDNVVTTNKLMIILRKFDQDICSMLYCFFGQTYWPL